MSVSPGYTLNPQRIDSARKSVIICFAWVALAPFSFWFATSNTDNIWLFVPAILFAIMGIAPLLFSGAVWSEYSDAKRGIHSTI